MSRLAIVATSACALASACSAPQSVAAPDAWRRVSDSIRVDTAGNAVEFDAVSVLKTGFLEEYVCTEGTREHESLFVFAGKASEIHAALLLAGLEPGTPGRWREMKTDDGGFRVEAVPPTGPAVTIRVILADGRAFPLDHFVRAAPVAEAAPGARPPHAFVFAGSKFVQNRRTGSERYAADGSGSLIGLVTFGDETIAPIEVISDQAEVSAPIWEAFTERMPEPGTAVRIRIRSENNADKKKGPVETEPQTEPFRGQGK